MERAAVAMTFAATGSEELRFGSFGLGEGEIGGNSEVGVELGIELVDAREEEFGELDGGELTFAEEFSDLLNGSEREIGVDHGAPRKGQGEFSTEDAEKRERG